MKFDLLEYTVKGHRGVRDDDARERFVAGSRSRLHILGAELLE